jgi:two-component system phosphate regulon response regulator PhoB
MQHSTILVVEDEAEIRELIVLHLEREAHQVVAAVTGDQALQMIGSQHFDLFVLDWMLPGSSGLEIARMVRRRAELHASSILMVTARTETHDIVAGLEAGADDYLTKPFDPPVLLARVRALLRRRTLLQAPEGDNGRYELGGLRIDCNTYEVSCAGSPMSLTPSEFKLLVALAQNRGKVLTRDSLIEHVQGEGVSVVGRTVDTHVFGLRKKLGACADVLETVRGIGYRVR